jgi:predicted CXXCH cytochrome family protein
MAPYDIPTDQLEKYQASVHWEMMSEQQDLSAPTCNDCHGNHGAAPPGVSWVGNVCGQCHSVMADMYAQSLHSQLFTMMGIPGCTTCHNNHEIHEANDELLGLGEGAVCSRCHVAGAGGGVLAATMRLLIDSLRMAVEVADSLLSKAEFSGMEVSEALFELQGAQTALVQARTAVHTFSVLAVEEEVAAGLEIAAAAYAHGEEVLDELQFRHVGLAISSAIILVLIIGLVLKIRQLEDKEPTT